MSFCGAGCGCGNGLLFCGVVLLAVSLCVALGSGLVDDEVAGIVVSEEEGDSRVVSTVLSEVGIVGSESPRQYATRRTHGVESRGESNVGIASWGIETGLPVWV